MNNLKLIAIAVMAIFILASCNSDSNTRSGKSNPQYSNTNYINAIHQKILVNWKKATYQMQLQPTRCTINITQSPGGKIDTVTITQCQASRKIKDTIKQAVVSSSPLPYKGYEDVYTNNIVLEFITR